MWPLVLGGPEAFQMPRKAIWRPQNTPNHWGGRGSASDPAGGAYSAPPNPLAGGEGADFQASGFGPLGLASPRPELSNPFEVKSYIRPWRSASISCGQFRDVLKTELFS